MAQNDPEARIAWPALDRRRATVNEASPANTDTHIAHDSEMVTERRQRFATILIGQGGLLQEGLKHIFDKTVFDVVASGSTVDELVLSPSLKQQALLLIVDAGDNPRIAIRQMELFKEHHPASRVAVLTRTDRTADIVLLLQAGANACFPGGATPLTFVKSLELVMLGETLLPSTLLASIPHREEARPEPIAGRCTATLTPREDRILRSLVEGHSNKEIARKLDIAEATVKAHVKSVLRKIGVRSRMQAAIWALNDASLDCPTNYGPPAPALAMVEAASPVPSSSDEEEEKPVELPGAANRALGDMVGVANSKPQVSKAVSRNVSAQQSRLLRPERWLAEEQERRDEVAAKIGRLRELREARTQQHVK
ncbi:MAG: LuxR C-terminal-related transcriptional regulator [Hyphomicrobiales bacterium]